jgi:hypothetical protein
VETETAQLLLTDVSRELVEKAKAAKADAERSGSDYDKGRHFALYEAVSLLAEQAQALTPSEICLEVSVVAAGSCCEFDLPQSGHSAAENPRPSGPTRWPSVVGTKSR